MGFSLQCHPALHCSYFLNPISNHYYPPTTEGIDYIQEDEECRTLKFELGHEGLQTICTYIEILDDDVIEPDKFFSVQLSSTNPRVIFTRDRATIRIIDDDGDEVLPTENTNCPGSTSPPPGATPKLRLLWGDREWGGRQLMYASCH